MGKTADFSSSAQRSSSSAVRSPPRASGSRSVPNRVPPSGARASVNPSVHSTSVSFCFSSRRRHTRLQGDWSSDVCSSDLSDIRRARRLDVVWTRSLRLVPAVSFLCRSHLEGSEAGRSSRSAANEVRTGHQPQDREGARPPNSRQTGCHRRRGDRMTAKMKRRDFITLLGGTAAAWPLVAGAQQAGKKMLRVGTVSALQQSSPTWAAFMRRMAELGYQEGKTFVFDLVLATSEEDYETGYRTLAAREPDIIMATGPESALKSALAVTRTLPIVMIAID